MNVKWMTFLSEQQVLPNGAADMQGKSADKSIFALTHLGVLKIHGTDAGKLLQGQMTCNIHDLSPQKSSIAAMCNPKGRVIATFIIARIDDYFILILSADLLDTVKSKLKMYVLRSDAKIEDASDEYCLMGIAGEPSSGQRFFTEALGNGVSIVLPGLPVRKVLVADTDSAIRYWSHQVEECGYRQSHADVWRFFDVNTGFPWVTAATSEEFIPQMLNLDKLGGISLNKGCYTGQEIVARTHYLGKSKRELSLAECRTSQLPAPNSTVLCHDNHTQDTAGKVVQATFDHDDPQRCLLLMVLHTSDTKCKALSLENQTPLTLKPLSYD